MSTILRHLLSIFLLPFMVAIVIPCWLLISFADTRPDTSTIIWWLPRSIGLLSVVFGLGLFIWCVSLFAKVGQGTLAPWDPTRKLVAVGPYQYLRNPMISSVAFVLIGQALFWVSWPIGLWAGIFILINHLYFILSEEPGLEERFGDRYRIYKANVPRWLPRRTPWRKS